MSKGWYRESRRHSLASRGIRTTTGIKTPVRHIPTIKTKYVKLKKPLYHGTTCSHLDDINERGLTRYHSSDVHVETKGRQSVFVTEDMYTALLYAYDASKECPADWLDMCDAEPSKMCIIKITKLPTEAKVTQDGYGDYEVDSDIPRECIEILRPKDLKKHFGVRDLMDAI